MAAPPPKPTAVRAPHGATTLELGWPGDLVHRLPHRLLRGYCPCAGCQGHSGSITFQPPSGSLALELRDIKQVGQYALAFTWGDGHSTGIYSFEFLFHLGRLIERDGSLGVEELGTLPRPGRS